MLEESQTDGGTSPQAAASTMASTMASTIVATAATGVRHRDGCQADERSERIRDGYARFRELGFEPGPLFGPRRTVPCGVPLRVPVRPTLRSPSALAALARFVGSVLREGVPLSIALSDLGTEDVVIRVLQKFCEQLGAALQAYGTPPRDLLGMSLASHQMPLQAFVLTTTVLLGAGPRYVVFDTLQMRHHDNARVAEETEQNWSYLWRNAGALIPVYGASVRTACPLLADEVAAAVLPGPAMPVPVESAWLTLELPLTRFADARGDIDWRALDEGIERAVDVADDVLPLLEWSRMSQLRDAGQNRRLAVLPAGLGDLVLRRGADPADLACLTWIDGIVRRLHAKLWARSRAIAKRRGPLPALSYADPSLRIRDRSHRDDWQQRWRDAVADGAVRNRNMLAMSPYSILPGGSAGSAAFTDLLPVIAHADSWCFAGAPAFSGWKYHEFKRFHRRAWAVMQGGYAASLVATGA